MSIKNSIKPLKNSNKPRPTKSNTLVTMYVDTTVKNLSQINIEQHVWMADSNGDISNNNAGKVKNYVSGAQRKGNITWVAAVYNISKAPSDTVLITNVTLKNDPSQKVKISLEPTKNYPTHINGKITKSAKVGDEFSYTIFFTVIRDGQTDLHLFIDPKIRVDPAN